MAEKTVGIIEDLCKENNIEVEIIPSMSFVDAMYNYLAVDPAEGFKLLDAFELEEFIYRYKYKYYYNSNI